MWPTSVCWNNGKCACIFWKEKRNLLTFYGLQCKFEVFVFFSLFKIFKWIYYLFSIFIFCALISFLCNLRLLISLQNHMATAFALTDLFSINFSRSFHSIHINAYSNRFVSFFLLLLPFFSTRFLFRCNQSWWTTQQLLPQKLLDENRARNIPALTQNQLAVIYKLIWYQDGYEQPSEEDLKRIMIVSDNDQISKQSLNDEEDWS